MGLDMLADEVDKKAWVHDRKRYVRIAVVDVQVTTRHLNGVMANLAIQMNPDHLNGAVDKMKRKSEPSYQPPRLLSFHFKIKGKLGFGNKFYAFTKQLLQVSVFRPQLHNPFVRS